MSEQATIATVVMGAVAWGFSSLAFLVPGQLQSFFRRQARWMSEADKDAYYSVGNIRIGAIAFAILGAILITLGAATFLTGSTT
jgi:hypothetical protein